MNSGLRHLCKGLPFTSICMYLNGCVDRLIGLDNGKGDFFSFYEKETSTIYLKWNILPVVIL